MTISSRTPEGTPNRCPVCGKDARPEPLSPPLFGEVRCSRCGCLLWFVRVQSAIRFWENEKAESVRERVIEIVAENLGVDKEQVRLDPSLEFLGWVLDELDFADLELEIEAGL